MRQRIIRLSDDLNVISFSSNIHRQTRLTQLSGQNPIPFFRRVACERGMNGGVNGTYPEYIITTQFTIQREILCDTQTDGGGWTVIQIK